MKWLLVMATLINLIKTIYQIMICIEEEIKCRVYLPYFLHTYENQNSV